MTHYNPKDTV